MAERGQPAEPSKPSWHRNSPPSNVHNADGRDPGDANRPRRAMGFSDLVLFYIVTGISLRWIATAAAAGPSSVVIWVVAWVAFFLPLALSVLELSSRYPEEGGLYVWSKRAFGDFAGFMAAWTYWTSNLPYFPAVLYFAAGNALYIGGDRSKQLSADAGYFVVFSLVALALITSLNVVGLDVGKWLHNVGALAMWLPVGAVVVMGLVAGRQFGSATEFSRSSLTPHIDLRHAIFWSTLTFALGGCEAASFMGGEIKNVRRNMPRALIVGSVFVTAAYILGTVAVLLALPSDQVSSVQGLMQAIARTAERVGLKAVTPATAFLVMLSNLGAAGAFLAAAARLPFVAGIDHYLPDAFGRLHARWRTPYVALLTQAICGAIFVFLGQAGTTVKGAYEVLVSMGVITYFIPYLFLFAAMLRLQREPVAPDVVRVPGGKAVARFLALLGFATTSITIGLSLIPPPDESNKVLAVTKVMGLVGLLVASGAWIYGIGRRRAAGRAGHEVRET